VGDAAAEDEGEDAAEEAVDGAVDGAAEEVGTVAGAHMKLRAPGMVTDEEPCDTTSL
jgi:hypothetical protein